MIRYALRRSSSPARIGEPARVWRESRVAALWEETALPGAVFMTVCGKRVVVRSIGQRNLYGGPDYRNAILEIEGKTATGFVEIHVNAGGWRDHAHHRNPLFDGVILHVVHARDGSETDPSLPPVVVLAEQIPAGVSPARSLSNDGGLPCSPMVSAAAARIEAMIALASAERLQRKTKEFSVLFQSRVSTAETVLLRREVLYRKWMRALGYGGNQDLMEGIALRAPLRALACIESPEERLSLLCRRLESGMGFLYATGDEQEAALLHAAHRHGPPRQGKGVRPGNRIALRLRYAACAVERFLDERWWARLEEAFQAGPSGRFSLAALTDLFCAKGEFLEKRAPGAERSVEIIVNVLIPFFLASASADENENLKRIAFAWYRSLAKAPENAVTRSMRRELGWNGPCTPLVQQGLIELHDAYCSRFRCGECLIGRMFR